MSGNWGFFLISIIGLRNKSMRQSITFCVGSENDIHSSCWKVWAHRNNVYIAVKVLGGVFKASLHESGQCQCSLTSEFISDKNMPNPLRHFDKWSRSMTGANLTFHVFIPITELRNFDEPKRKSITWIPAPPENYFTEVLFFFLEPDFKLNSEWPGQKSMGTQLIEKFVLPNKELFYIVYKNQRMTENHIRDLGIYRASVRSFAPKDAPLSTRAILIGHQADGSRNFIEIAMD